MRASAYRDLSDQELGERAAGLRQSLFNLRVRNATKELQNSSQISRERRELARALTVINERRQKAQPSQAPAEEPSGSKD